MDVGLKFKKVFLVTYVCTLLTVLFAGWAASVPVGGGHAVPSRLGEEQKPGPVPGAGHRHQVHGQDVLLEEEDGQHHRLRPDLSSSLPRKCAHWLGER